MRWTYFICVLLVSAVIAKPRPKRSLGYIKNVISSKLFGSKTLVIAQPTLAENQTYQLFRIPGFNDILIKVTRKNEPVKVDPEIQDAALVKPEVAIIGSYLGTQTEKETLLAIEMVKGLLRSGVLTVPNVPIMPQEYEGNVYPYSFVQEPGRVFVPIAQLDTLIPALPPRVDKPGQTKYFYKQKGAQTDTTYESYNNGDVTVSTTLKEPPLPQFLKLRIAEVATIGANPYMFSQNGVSRGPIPVPYYVNPAIITENVQRNYMLPDSLSPQLQNMRRVIVCRENFEKLCPHENIRDETDKAKVLDKQNQPKDKVVSVNLNKSEGDARKLAINEFLKKQSVNGQLMSQYLYKQMNHHSHDNYTIVRVGEAPKLSHEGYSTSDLNKDFVYVPPKDMESSMLNVLKLHNNADTDKAGRKLDDKNAFVSNPLTNDGKSDVTSQVTFKKNSFKNRPIVVEENTHREAKSNEDEIIYKINENRRGDIPGSTYK